MKNKVLSAAVLILVCALAFSSCSSCSLFDKIKDQLESISENLGGDDAETFSPEEKKVEEVLTGKADLDAMSRKELLAYIDALQNEDSEALNQGAEYDLFYGRADASDGFDADAELSFDYPADAKAVVITDDPWEDKDFEAVDVTANMSPEDKAEYDAMMQELENFDADAYQKEIDEMLQEMQGFEDYEPDSDEDEDPDAPSMLEKWPDSALGRQVPTPPFTDAIITESDDSITLLKMGATIEEVKDYVSKLKAAGFTIDMTDNEQTVAGFSIYTFMAENAAGYYAKLTFSAGTATFIVIERDK
ncbi:MAG: hypothetical protein IK088_07795 [Lachnospiraceae bacterium]|nr:hypothetical protein [Lachnospiraceae bacterium]